MYLIRPLRQDDLRLVEAGLRSRGHARQARSPHVPLSFVRGKPLEIELIFDRPVASVSLYYRHVNQAERFKVAVMDGRERRYHATIPGAYTDSAYPLQYYFQVKTMAGRTQICPGFSGGLTNQPYIVVRTRADAGGR